MPLIWLDDAVAANAMTAGISGSRAAAPNDEGPPSSNDEQCLADWSGFDLAERRWLLRIAQQLLRGPMRFSDLRLCLAGLSANILTQRLLEMTQAGLVEKRDLAPPARSQGYALSERGDQLADVISALVHWNDRFHS